MSLFTRISATVCASVDKAVTRVENHDAIIHANIRDTREAAARSRVRLARVRKDGDKMRNRLEKLKRDEALWTDRARNVAEDDKNKALECLKRRQACRQQIEQTESALRQHVELENKLAAGVQKIEARVQEVSEQRNMLRSRQSVAEATRLIENIEGDETSVIEETFDRWEIMIGESELAVGADISIDTLEASFSESEHSELLEAELDELLDNTTGN